MHDTTSGLRGTDGLGSLTPFGSILQLGRSYACVPQINPINVHGIHALGLVLTIIGFIPSFPSGFLFLMSASYISLKNLKTHSRLVDPGRQASNVRVDSTTES